MVKSLLRSLLIKGTGPRFQQTIRRYYLTRQIVAGRSFFEPEVKALKELVVAGDVVADIGANAGSYAKELSFLVGTQGKVYAFEPVPETFDILQNVVKKARLNNVMASRLALGAQARFDKMVIPNMDGFTGYYWAHLAQPGDAGRSVDVVVKTFDEWVCEQRLERLDFVKCDVEGGELDILRGSGDVIRRFKPGWLIEVSRTTSKELFDRLLLHHGYQAFVYDDGLVPTQGYRDKEYSNYFFLHPERRRI